MYRYYNYTHQFADRWYLDSHQYTGRCCYGRRYDRYCYRRQSGNLYYPLPGSGLCGDTSDDGSGLSHTTIWSYGLRRLYGYVHYILNRWYVEQQYYSSRNDRFYHRYIIWCIGRYYHSNLFTECRLYVYGSSHSYCSTCSYRRHAVSVRRSDNDIDTRYPIGYMEQQ
jgi:hypothetical protein